MPSSLAKHVNKVPRRKGSGKLISGGKSEETQNDGPDSARQAPRPWMETIPILFF